MKSDTYKEKQIQKLEDELKFLNEKENPEKAFYIKSQIKVYKKELVHEL